jgi:integrase
MSRNKRLISPSYANGDYCYVWLTTEINPEIEFIQGSQHIDFQTIDQATGEIFECKIKQRQKPSLIRAPYLCCPKGNLVFPVLLYMRSLVALHKDESTLMTHIQALLMFYRWLHKCQKTIYDCNSEIEKGVVYQFRDFLLKNVKKESYNPELKVNETQGRFSASTCATYLLKIVQFYVKLDHQRVLQFSESFKPFEFKIKIIERKSSSRGNILANLNSKDRSIVVETTGLTAPFGKVQSPPSSHSLKPMLEEDKEVFYEYIQTARSSYFDEENIKNLMLELATETGLRLEEFVTFPASEVVKNHKHSDNYKVTISENLNGCLTKFNKERTIVISEDLMCKLRAYLFSVERASAINKAQFRHNCLFVKLQDGLPYSTNTLQKHFETVRNNIRIENIDWYYTAHDMRATFATNWLFEQHKKRGTLFEILIGELAEIMGHESTTDTQKYVDYMEDEKNWKAFATSKNYFIRNVQR